MMELSIAEQKLISFARDEFDEALTQFLLAGLGEEAVAQSWRLTINYSVDDAISLEREVMIITYEPADGRSYLPRQRDALVLIAFLQLLVSNSQTSQNDLLYDQEDVLNLLGWGDTQEARDEIDEALDRYSLIMFRWVMNSTELINRNLSGYTERGSYISAYKTLDRGKTEDEQMRRAQNQVTFNAEFVVGLKRRSLFGIDWNRVNSVKLDNC